MSSKNKEASKKAAPIAPRAKAKAQKAKPPPKRRGAGGKGESRAGNYMVAAAPPAPAQQTSSAIKISVDPCVEGVQTIPIPAIMYALQLGAVNTPANPIYHAYFYMVNDLVALMGGQTGAASRLRYLNYVLPTIVGKTVPFCKSGEITYSWKGLGNIIAPTQINCRGQRTSLYVENNASVYVAPSQPGSDKEAFDSYVKTMASVYTNMLGNTYFDRKVELSGDFLHDASAFARVAPYHGQGVSDCFGWWCTAESEVPFRNPGLGLSLFVPSANRSSRFIHPGSCDPCVNYNVGLLNVPLSLYKTAYPIVLKAVDFDEIFFAFQWWLKRISIVASQGNSLPVGVVDPETGIPDVTFPHLEPYGLMNYAVAFRQVLLKQFFGLGNTLGQFCRPINSNNSWEAFRIGTNSAPIGPWEPIIFPTVLNENMKMLLPAVYSQAKNDNYRREKNGSLIIPVLGRYTQNILPQVALYGQVVGGNPQVISWTEQLFGGPSGAPGLNLIECSENSNLFNANSGAIMQSITFLNQYIQGLKQFSAPTEYCGGSPSPQSRLLLTTRYVKFFNVSQEVKPSAALNYLVENNKIKHIKKDQKGKFIYAPGNSSLTNERDVGISSYYPTTNDFRLLLNNLILPIMELDDGTNQDVSQEQIQSETREVFSTRNSDDTGDVILEPDRASRLKDAAGFWATGLAATKSDSLSNYVEELLLGNGGGFFGDLFGTVSSVAGAVGKVAGTLGI